jgi:hypothetical protein
MHQPWSYTLDSREFIPKDVKPGDSWSFVENGSSSFAALFRGGWTCTQKWADRDKPPVCAKADGKAVGATMPTSGLSSQCFDIAGCAGHAPAPLFAPAVEKQKPDPNWVEEKTNPGAPWCRIVGTNGMLGDCREDRPVIDIQACPAKSMLGPFTDRHWGKHWDDFGCRTVARYEHMADRFLSGPRLPRFFECTRSGGDFIRYDTATNEFAVLALDGMIRTYYKPQKCSSLPPAVRRIKQCHKHPTHMDYVRWACTQ